MAGDDPARDPQARVQVPFRVLAGLLGSPAVEGRRGLVLTEVFSQVYGSGLPLASLYPPFLAADHAAYGSMDTLPFCVAIVDLARFRVLEHVRGHWFRFEDDPGRHRYAPGFGLGRPCLQADDHHAEKFEIDREFLGPVVGDRWSHQFRRAALSGSVRTLVLERDAYRCVWCGSYRELRIDHIYPLSLGGPDVPGNMQTLCRSCNQLKSNKLVFGPIGAE